MTSKKLNYTEIGNRIRKVRESKNITIEAASVDIPASVATISHIENGMNSCKLETLAKIAACYETSLDYLIFGKTPDDIGNDELEHVLSYMSTSEKNDILAIIKIIHHLE